MSGLKVVARLSPCPISFPSLPSRSSLEADAQCDWRTPNRWHASQSLHGRMHQQGVLPSSAFPFLCRLVKGSRDERPRGSLPAFAGGDVATSIRSITERLSLFPLSFTRYLIGSPYSSLPRAEDIGLTVFRISNRMR